MAQHASVILVVTRVGNVVQNPPIPQRKDHYLVTKTMLRQTTIGAGVWSLATTYTLLFPLSNVPESRTSSDYNYETGQYTPSSYTAGY